MFGKCYKERLKNIKEIKNVQKKNLTDDYMVGIYNGMELALAIMENREPVYETKTVKMYSYKTRTYIEGTKDYKWSYKNDRTLLDAGYQYTGNYKVK